MTEIAVTKVSIIVPMYRVEEYISDCIESVLAQTQHSWELICVNDGSPDASGKIADDYAIKDARIRVIHQRNQGVSAARNAGLDDAVGEFVSFIDGDDWIAPDFLAEMLGVAENSGADYVISTKVMTGRTSTHGKLFARWTASNAVCALLYAEIPIGCWNKLFRRQMIEDAKLRFLTRYQMGEGLNFITMAAQHARTIVATDHAAYHYRRDNPYSATTKVSVSKMVNALDAIENINRDLIVRDSAIEDALAYQEFRTGFSGLGASLREENAEAQKRFAEVLKRVKFGHLMRVRVSLVNRLIALAIRVDPIGAARLRVGARRLFAD